MNFSDVIKTFTAKEEIAVYSNAGKYVNGRWESADSFLYKTTGAVQPLTDDEMEMIPERYRNGKSLKIYLKLTDVIDTDYIVYYKGVFYKVISHKKYEHISDYQIITVVEVQR